MSDEGGVPPLQAGDEPDDVLAVAARAGDLDAFGTLYARHAPAIFDFLARTVRNPAVAEDLVQTTFVRALEHRGDLKDPARVRSWLYSIAHHLAMNQLSRSPRTEPLEGIEGDSQEIPPEAFAEADEAAELVWAAAAGLAPRQYAVLDLTLRHELSTPEVAEVLAVEAGHAAVLVHRAKEALGSAVRSLLVARSRDRCDRLAALVPSVEAALAPSQRATVDRHLRRCQHCSVLASKLTAPEVLLSALAPVAFPAHLAIGGFAGVLSAWGSAGRGGTLGSRMKRLVTLRSTVAATVILAASAGLAIGLSAAGARPGHPPERLVHRVTTTTAPVAPTTTTTSTPVVTTTSSPPAPAPPPVVTSQAPTTTTTPVTTTTTTEPPPTTTTTTTEPPPTTTTTTTLPLPPPRSP
jgi:RNA polymerase sigma factor (sigma-70 family)